MHTTVFVTIFMFLFTLFSTPVFAVMDLDAPTIRLDQEKVVFQQGVGYVVKATIQDETGIQSVLLYFRAMDTGNNFQTLPMQLNPESGFYTAALPRNVLKVPGMEYYVEARDTSTNMSQAPYPKQPKPLRFAKLPPMPDLKGTTVATVIENQQPVENQPIEQAIANKTDLPELGGEISPADESGQPNEKSGGKWKIILGVLGGAALIGLAAGGGGGGGGSEPGTTGTVEVTW